MSQSFTSINPERRTYQSRNSTYNLDASRVFEVVEDLGRYIRTQYYLQNKIGPGLLRSATSLIGRGRELALRTEVVDNGLLTGFDLANIVLSDDWKDLTMNVFAHPKVAIDPSQLYRIGDKYEK